jgi:pimeloyl-ACP methyl ester carboxylesterase
MKSRIAKLALGYGAVMAAWGGYSCAVRNRPLPAGAEAEEYKKSLLQAIGSPELYGTWREEILPAGGRQLHLYHFESEPGDPVMVFMHGTSIGALFFVKFMYELSRQGFNVVGMDARGHGFSGGKRGDYTLGGLVEDALAVIDYAIDAYGDKVAISGTSQGGMTAFYCAAAEPRLKAAVCHTMTAPDEPDNYRITRWPGLYRILMATQPLAQPFIDLLGSRLMVPIAAYLDDRAEVTKAIPSLHDFIEQDPLALHAVSLAALTSLADTPMARKAEDIETPVMVVYGGRDNIFPEDYVRRVYGRLTCRKEFLYLPQAPHLIILDYVDETVPPIAAWLKEVMGA